ncbi:MAG: transcriptional regulator, MarR family [Frankiales bacterium]|nr:transcriptional regulator, MarR family [Frankiales bacterium]
MHQNIYKTDGHSRPKMNFVTNVETAASAAPGVKNDLGWALATVLRAYVRSAHGVLAGIPGGARGYRVLASVAHDCPISQLALAQLVGLDRTVVTYLLDDLAAAGLVERQAAPADRRARRVVATTAGEDRLSQAERDLHRVEEQLLGGLGAADASAFRVLLQRTAIRLSTEGPESDACVTIDEFRPS